jgi:FkbM family methyltransferase
MISRILNFVGYRLIDLANKINLDGYRKHKIEDPDDLLWVTFPLNKDSLAVDVGGLTGDWASKIYGRYSCYIDIYEPHPVSANKAALNFLQNAKVDVVPFALSSVEGTMTLYGEVGSASLYKEGDTTTAHTVRVMKASDVFNLNYSIRDIDVLKINIEGAEYDVLTDLLDNYNVTKIKRLLIQFHKIGSNYEGKKKVIQDRLMKTHTQKWNYEYVWELWERKSP